MSSRDTILHHPNGTRNTNGPVQNGSSPASKEKVEISRHPHLVVVQDTPKGRGVFAEAPIPARTVIEVSPVLVLDAEEYDSHVRHTKLWFYSYNWNSKKQALPLGLGSLFNHASARSRRQNTGFTRDFANETITYITLRDIGKGEELCICYGEEGRLGFADVDADADGEEEQPEGGDDGSPQRGKSLVELVDLDVFADGR